ncbi:c-type cytochrome [Sulfitobacter sp. 1A12157]|uniref:c-type cytochrome n=1 Tax=Sulfitobacter sp. 1A12157 TaxID=3368594 RepID=UPI003744E4E5
MKTSIATILTLCLGATPLLAESHASGDPEAGEKVFRKCKSCHMITDDEGNDIQKGGRTGPNLYGIFDRVAGSVEDYRYGDSIVAAGEAGLKWNEEDFVAYLADTKGFLADYLDQTSAKSKMSYRLKDEDDAKDVWAYLVSVGPEVEMEAEADAETEEEAKPTE